jgi:hypothetical protein
MLSAGSSRATALGDPVGNIKIAEIYRRKLRILLFGGHIQVKVEFSPSATSWKSARSTTTLFLGR